MEQLDNRDNILKVALRIFAEKGYDGARIDAIAQEAGVNKALIYYYFNSKHDILDTLFHSFFADLKQFLYNMLKDIDLTKESWSDELFLRSFSFLEDKSDILRLILIESLKKDPDGTHLFEFVDMLLGEGPNSLFDFAHKFGSSAIELRAGIEQTRVTEFFTLLAPTILYIVFREKWEIFFKADKETFRQQFVSAVQATHIAAHHDM